MDAALGIALLWVGFAATHVGLSHPPVRGRLVGALSAGGYQGLYSAVALLFFVPLVGLYFGHKHEGTWLWTLPRGPLLVWLVYVLMALAFTLVVGALLRPTPAGIVAGPAAVRGVHRLTRHPLVMGAAVFGATHMLLNSAASDLAFFGGFIAFAVIGALHQDHRKLLEGPAEFREFYAHTRLVSFSPSAAVGAVREAPLALAIGVGATILVRFFHAA